MLLLAVAAVAVGWFLPRLVLETEIRADALAWTECPWRSPARVTLTRRVSPEDSLPVLAHEREHAAQCDTLGPLRYRLRNLTAGGRMSLEAPAYCAGARQRIRMGLSRARARERLLDDATSAFHGRLDAADVVAALTVACPDIVGGTFAFHGRPRQLRRSPLVISA